jgi:putative sigma-54 modulation protein
MQIDIQARGFTLTEGLREYVERRLSFVFASTRRSVRRISVRLSDENGPRGGDDKRCRMQVNLAAAPSVVIEDTETSLYVAIDRAADRIGRTVTRRIERLRKNRRSSRPRTGGASSRSGQAPARGAPAAAPNLDDGNSPV